MESFNSIYTDILLANYAKLGSWAFYEEFMFSTTGTYNGVYSENFEEFYPGYFNEDDGDSTDVFIPNLTLNAKTGEQ
jgi:hypothetical protein